MRTVCVRNLGGGRAGYPSLTLRVLQLLDETGSTSESSVDAHTCTVSVRFKAPAVGFRRSTMCVDSPAARVPGSQVGESALKPIPLAITHNWSTTNPLCTLLYVMSAEDVTAFGPLFLRSNEKASA